MNDYYYIQFIVRAKLFCLIHMKNLYENTKSEGLVLDAVLNQCKNHCLLGFGFGKERVNLRTIMANRSVSTSNGCDL